MGEERSTALSARDKFGRQDFSDHLMLIRVFYAYQTQASNRVQNFCKQNFLNHTALKMIYGIKKQLVLELKRLRLLPSNVMNYDDPEVNIYSNCWPMIQGAIVAGCYPGIGFVRSGSKLRKIRTSLHPSSVIKRQILNPNKRPDIINRYNTDSDPNIEYLTFQEMARIDEGLTLRTVTVVPPLTVFFFAGPIRTSKEIVESFELGKKISLKCIVLAEEDIPPEVLKNEEMKRRKLEQQIKSCLLPSSSKVNGTNSEVEHLEKLFANAKNVVDPNFIPLVDSSTSSKCPEDDSGDSDVIIIETDKEQNVHDEETNIETEKEYVLELESWLAFKGTFEVMQALARIRFKFMSYLLKFLKDPSREITTEEENLLECVSDVLCSDHKKNFFNPCDDLPSMSNNETVLSQQERSFPNYNNTRHKSRNNFYGNDSFRRYANNYQPTNTNYFTPPATNLSSTGNGTNYSNNYYQQHNGNYYNDNNVGQLKFRNGREFINSTRNRI